MGSGARTSGTGAGDGVGGVAHATKASKATQLQNAYKVEGVPAMGVAGRFYTDGTLAKNMSRVLQVVDHLVLEVRAGR